MKKTLITIALAIVVIAVKAQTNTVKDCDTSKMSFGFLDTPCKVPIFKNGKITGYYEKNIHLGSYVATSTLHNFSLTTFKQAKYRWIVFNPLNGPHWYIDNPDENGGRFIMHIKKSQLKWLNDSTAVYSNRK